MGAHPRSRAAVLQLCPHAGAAAGRGLRGSEELATRLALRQGAASWERALLKPGAGVPGTTQEPPRPSPLQSSPPCRTECPRQTRVELLTFSRGTHRSARDAGPEARRADVFPS